MQLRADAYGMPKLQSYILLSSPQKVRQLRTNPDTTVHCAINYQNLLVLTMFLSQECSKSLPLGSHQLDISCLILPHQTIKHIWAASTPAILSLYQLLSSNSPLSLTWSELVTHTTRFSSVQTQILLFRSV